MKAGKKVIVIHVKDDIEKEELMKEIQRLNLPAFIYVHGKLNSLKINIQGTKDEIREAMHKIRDIQKRVHARLYTGKKGLYEYTLEDIFRGSQITVAAPILLKALELIGEKVSFDGEKLKTSLPWEDIVQLSRKLGDALSQIALQTTRQIREVAIPVAVAYNLDAEEVLDKLVELGLAEFKEDKFKYELIKNKEQALEELIKSLEGEEDEN
ncbi:hypothetical protein PAP_09065 [Palaeococcus pacificus DY20341]|uniref:DUF2067 domain-containing protein n=1 Tax=Palaeococcus pacificus DY20341 TaxID=1343739 RepID=A0A075M066_9EURY|nr:DUF2067 family protein [Palaeococcus pacificus]AIF70193.1 hypothetical protein PAP_09065 [Palaeococcus pacificus DY20341]